MLCRMCGLQNADGAVRCTRCGTELAQPAQPPAPGYGPPSGYGPPPGYGPQPAYGAASAVPPPWYQLRGIGTATVVVLGICAVAVIASALVSGVGLGLLLALGQLAAAVLVLIWFHQARANAAWTHWPQPLARPWAIWGWFVPVIFLWFPVRIMAGIWRASQPSADRARPMVTVAAWWSCWLLAWFTGYRHTSATVHQGGPVTVSISDFGLYFEGNLVSKLFAAAAAVLLGFVVWSVSAGPLGADAPVPPA